MNSLPSWLTERCPPWCVVVHRDDDPPVDRVHYGEIAEVRGNAGSDEALRVFLRRHTDEPSVSVGLSVGAEDHALEPAAAALLVDAVTRALDQIRDPRAVRVAAAGNPVAATESRNCRSDGVGRQGIEP